MDTLKLKKAVEIDGKMITEIEYDLDSVTGKDIEAITKELQRDQYVVLAQETDPILHAHIFAISAGIAYSDMKLLGGKDYSLATMRVRDFFYME